MNGQNKSQLRPNCNAKLRASSAWAYLPKTNNVPAPQTLMKPISPSSVQNCRLKLLIVIWHLIHWHLWLGRGPATASSRWARLAGSCSWTPNRLPLFLTRYLEVGQSLISISEISFCHIFPIAIETSLMRYSMEWKMYKKAWEDWMRETQTNKISFI